MIQELMITNKKGICYLYYNFLREGHNIIDRHLIASFLDQVCMVFKLELNNTIGMIKLNKIMFSFYDHPKSELRLIFKCDNNYNRENNINNNTMKKSLDIIAKRVMDHFFSEYREKIVGFCGKIGDFLPFIKKIESFFKVL